jgi:hypothetical protein
MSPPSAGLRRGLRLCAVATLMLLPAMMLVAIGTVVWWAAMAVRAPWFVAGPELRISP